MFFWWRFFDVHMISHRFPGAIFVTPKVRPSIPKNCWKSTLLEIVVGELTLHILPTICQLHPHLAKFRNFRKLRPKKADLFFFLLHPPKKNKTPAMTRVFGTRLLPFQRHSSQGLCFQLPQAEETLRNFCGILFRPGDSWRFVFGIFWRECRMLVHLKIT